MGKEMIDVSRRDFLKGAGIGALSVAAAGSLAASGVVLAGEMPPGGEFPGGEFPGAESGNGVSYTSGLPWRTPIPEVTDFVRELDFDAVCVGHGYAGLTACRELAEQGYKVALIELQAEETYRAMGNESASFNSKLAIRFGIPEVDPVEYFQNWMAGSQNLANPELIMKYCQNAGTTADWYYSELTEEDIATLTTTGWPGGDHRLTQIGAFKFWPGTISCYGACNQTKVQGYNREVAKSNGAEFFFEANAQYVIMNNGVVAGIVATLPDGNYKFNCKAVVIATGGFHNNIEMKNDLMGDLASMLVEGESFTGNDSSYFGRGVQMAYWAGAHLESYPVPGMNAKHIQPPSGMSNLPQAVWLDMNGKRFCDEYYPIVEHRGTQVVFRERTPINCVFDSDFALYRQYYVPQHGAFDPTPANIASVEAAMEKAKAKFDGTWDESQEPEQQGPFRSVDYLCDDTLEGLAGQLGLTGDAVTNFVASIERYNGYCDKGKDEEFGRDPQVLFPVKKAPFFAAAGNPGLGGMMCTLGGIITDGEQNALDKNFKPIPGLYVSGNDCGRRFGLEYFTPTPGVSLGLVITLGRECGRSVAKFLG